jgi:hypothetical protein
MKDSFEPNENPMDSGVKGIDADDMYQNTPVFDVTDKEFYGNMRRERNKLNFDTSDKPRQFIQQDINRKPFYTRFTDDKGQQNLSKIK